MDDNAVSEAQSLAAPSASSSSSSKVEGASASSGANSVSAKTKFKVNDPSTWTRKAIKRLFSEDLGPK